MNLLPIKDGHALKEWVLGHIHIWDSLPKLKWELALTSTDSNPFEGVQFLFPDLQVFF